MQKRRILPAIAELREGWTSNRVVILVDRLSSPSEIVASSDIKAPEDALRSLRERMRKSNREAQAFVRYYRGDFDDRILKLLTENE